MTAGELLALAGMDVSDLADLHLGYTESQGNPALRAQIAAQYPGVEAEEVVLVAPEEGIYTALRTLLEPGDHVVVLTPAYESLVNLAEHIVGSGRVDKWEIEAGGGRWQINLSQLETLVTDRTRLIIVNFPHNPTGFLPTPDEFQAIIEIARKHGTWLFCDEMYRGLERNGRSPLPAAVTQYGRAISLAGLSKAQGLPGLRIGWLIIRDAEIRRRLINWKFYTTICPPAPSELLATAALRANDKLVARNNQIIARNLDIAESFFARWPDLFTWRPPTAGSVALVGINVPSAAAYCHTLAQEAGVLLLPGPSLGYDDHHVRMGFGRASFGEALSHYEQTLRTGSHHPRPKPAVTFTHIDELRGWLNRHNVDLTFWGDGNAKSVPHLWQEYVSGETRLREDPPRRMVNVAQVIIRRGQKVLLEAEQVMENGSRRSRRQPPSEKFKPGETYLDATRRCLQEELGAQPEAIHISPETHTVHTERRGSSSYPGLLTEYTFHTVEAQVDGLQEASFWRENTAVSQGDPVRRHLWEWGDGRSFIRPGD
jgi:aspartate/methionine/tyrosine aminotransferase